MERARGKADVIIGKNRHGRPETVRMAFFGDYSLFDNLEETDARGDNDFGNSAPAAPVLDGGDFEPMPVDTDAIPDDMPL